MSAEGLDLLLMDISWFRHVKQPLSLQQYAIFGKDLERSENDLYWSFYSKAFTRGMHPHKTNITLNSFTAFTFKSAFFITVFTDITWHS